MSKIFYPTVWKNKYIIKKISVKCMLRSDFHANQIVFVWSVVKRLGSNGFNFPAKGNIPVIFSSMDQDLSHRKTLGTRLVLATLNNWLYFLDSTDVQPNLSKGLSAPLASLEGKFSVFIHVWPRGKKLIDFSTYLWPLDSDLNYRSKWSGV